MKKHSTSIVIEEIDPRFSVKKRNVQKICTFILERLDLASYELCVSFLSPLEMQAINRTYRGKDYVTDVLSFPQESWEKPLFFQNTKSLDKVKKFSGPPKVLGDLMICLEKAEESALNLGHGLDREIAFLLVHGILHLAGHDHEIPEEEVLMTGEQLKFINALSQGPEPLWENCICLTGKNL